MKIYAKTIDNASIIQAETLAASPLGEGSSIAIMPDAHTGKGCVIGLTMTVTDKVCPNLVGVDIGCGVNLFKLNPKITDNLDILDKVIHQKVPAGTAVHKHNTVSQFMNLPDLRCWDALPPNKERTYLGIGSLGGGNHFIEAYADGYIAIHTGSRYLGNLVAQYYQNVAKSKNNFGELSYLTDKDLENYMHDIEFVQQYATNNRNMIYELIRNGLEEKGFTTSDEDKKEKISSVHNYIDIAGGILRKGAISAKAGEKLVIPLNMRDGLLVCEGKGNADWNYSAPHGAGRLYSRTKSKEVFTVEEFQKSMEGIYTSCVSQGTLDEAPFCYKDYNEIMELIEPTVTIEKRLIPIYNFKVG